MINSTRSLAALFLIAALACTAIEGTPPGSSPGAPVWICGADVSGSMRADAVQACRDVLAQAPPGTHVQVRLISSQSFSTEVVLVDAHIQGVPDCANRFDVACARLRRRELQKSDSTREVWLQRLDSVRRPAAPATDLYGFVAASVLQVFEASENTGEHRLVLVTDLKDTASLQDEASVDLSGITIEVRFESRDGPAEFLALRDAFEEWACAHGATRIEFHPVFPNQSR